MSFHAGQRYSRMIRFLTIISIDIHHTTVHFFCTQMTQMQAARISQILHAKNPINLCCLHLCAFENVQ